jgi:hypothetical protein
MQRPRPPRRSVAYLTALCTILLLVAASSPFAASLSQPVRAAVLLNETFKNASATGFISGGDACLTAGTQGATPAGSIPGCGNPALDPVGSGALRLTSNENLRAGFVIYNTPIPAGAGLSVTFDQFQYNGSGADGIGFFLIDATQPTQPTQPGASGGSLGYAQRQGGFGPDTPGLTAGYAGLGLDAFGNFSNPTEGRQGGPGFSPNSVVLRGSGNGFSGYSFILKKPAGSPRTAECGGNDDPRSRAPPGAYPDQPR